jgi:diguanylate cyclase (GGDEF)-like protein
VPYAAGIKTNVLKGAGELKYIVRYVKFITGESPLHINVAKKEILDLVLRRKKWNEMSHDVLDLNMMFKTILKWANEFFPSESGSILLDNPLFKRQRNYKKGMLYFVACYGKGSRALMGSSLPGNVGIVGKTYTTGKPYISRNVKKDKYFHGDLDKKTKFVTRSIICAPIEIRGSVIGVIELINRLDKTNYDRKDLTLLKIFAGYTSTLVQNSLDARRFRDLSIRDNLTGIFNDRYFFSRLADATRYALRNNGDVSLIFLDLDRFKEVNDTYGHLAGSHVLSEVGDILFNFTDDENFIPVRYGGDEFTVILPATDIKSAAGIAERLRKTIEEYVFLNRRVPGTQRAIKLKGHISCSIGVSSLKTNRGVRRTVKLMSEAIIKRADIAMYISKVEGKNAVTLAPGKVPGSPRYQAK